MIIYINKISQKRCNVRRFSIKIIKGSERTSGDLSNAARQTMTTERYTRTISFGQNYDEVGVEATESTSILHCATDGLATTSFEANTPNWVLIMLEVISVT